MKMGYPEEIYNYIIDTHHTPHYALGYLFDQVQPRFALATHLEYEPSTLTEVVAGIRAHWDGLFAFGAPDVQVVNVTPDAVWIREAVLPGLGTNSQPTAAQMAKLFMEDGEVPEFVDVPAPRRPREEQQDPYFREIEIDPEKYMPPDVARDLVLSLPPDIRIPLKQMLEQAGVSLEDL
jgi:ribonuclease Z